MKKELLKRTCSLVALMVLTLMTALPTTAWAADNNDETVVIDGVSYHVLRDSEDWTRLSQLVVDAAGKSDVNAIMDADFTVNNSIGTSTYPYRGIFNGNGHTLNLNIDAGTNNTGAPFLTVAGATFKNLHVTGTVKGAIHSSGLVSGVTNKPSVYFENVWVSANVSTNSRYLAGFLAHCSDADVYVTDCRFDGTLTSSSNENTYGCAFIGWGGEGSWTFHRAYENGVYSIKGNSGGFCRDSSGDKWWGSNSRSTLCISSHNWGEMKDGNHRSVTNQNTVLSRMNAEKPNSWNLVGGKAVPVLNTNGLDATFELYDMIPGTESGDEGMLKIPFSCDQAVKWIEASYTDENGKTKDLGRTTLAKNTYAGFIKVPATEQHHNLKIRAKLLVGEINVTYDAKNDAIMHAPLQLKADLLRVSEKSVTDAGAMQLQWIIRNPKYNDVVDGDQFVIMRSITGKMEDLTQLGSVPFDSSDSVYTYKDETLMSALTAEMLENDAQEVRYVVIRATAQQLWGVSNNPASATVTSPLNLLNLLRIKDYTAKWESQSAKTINVSWEYADEFGAVWDQRAKMKMLVTTSNRAGAVVDSTIYELTASEMTARMKEVQLNRSCVNYKIEMFTERGTSAFPLRPNYFEISTAEDWTTFVNKVKDAGGKGINAILLDDITVTEMAGQSESAPFHGTFDGNGHTLTININNANAQNAAPFRYAKDFSIRNLHTDGSITSNQKFIGGIVSRVLKGNYALIEGCRSSIKINSTVNGDATNGGIVAMNSCPQLIICNCLFDGKFTGANCYQNGGIIGWLDNSEATIENCLFAPSEISTNFNGCATWARNESHATVINCYATKEYCDNITIDGKTYFVLRNNNDWVRFRDLVVKANGNSDVNAIMEADITGEACIGWEESYAYRGTFDGNGHKLTFNYDGGSAEYIAPFRHVKDAYFKDLYVAGNIKGGLYAAGLVGTFDGSPNVKIERVRVAATVDTSKDRIGGFVGHTNNAIIKMSDCCFEGTLDAYNNGITNGYMGAIFGWGYDDEWELHRVYVSGNFYNMSHIAFCYRVDKQGSGTIHAWGYNNISTLCVAYKDWGEMAPNCSGVLYPMDMMNNEKPGSWIETGYRQVPAMETRDLSNLIPADELVELLGTSWTKDDNGKVIPKAIDKRQAEVNNSIKNPYRIYTDEDWGTFVNMVKEANNKRDIYAILMADISITEPVGANANYRGTFDGGGHTLTVNIDIDKEKVAPFKTVTGITTIRNLRVKGNVKGKQHAAGLVGAIDNSATLLVENCHISDSIITTNNYAGGIIGHGNSSHVTVRNCLFDGTITNTATSGASYAGAFIGWSEKDCTHATENCLDNGTYNKFQHAGANYHYDGGGKLWGGTNNWTY